MRYNWEIYFSVPISDCWSYELYCSERMFNIRTQHVHFIDRKTGIKGCVNSYIWINQILKLKIKTQDLVFQCEFRCLALSFSFHICARRL